MRVTIDRIVLAAAALGSEDTETFRSLLTRELSAALDSRHPTSSPTRNGAAAPSTRALARRAAHTIAAVVRREARA